MTGSFLKIKNRSSLGIDHVFELQKKGKCEINGKTNPKGCKREVDKEKPDIFGSHSQLIGKA